MGHHVLDEEGVVAQAIRVVLILEAEALVRKVASVLILVGASPVRAALVATLSTPSRLADAEVVSSVTRRVAESVMAIQVARWLVAEVSLPAAVTNAGVRMINASAMGASCHGFTSIAVFSRPSIVADAFIGMDAVAIGAIATAWNVAVCPFPPILTIALKGIKAGTMFTSR